MVKIGNKKRNNKTKKILKNIKSYELSGGQGSGTLKNEFLGYLSLLRDMFNELKGPFKLLYPLPAAIATGFFCIFLLCLGISYFPKFMIKRFHSLNICININYLNNTTETANLVMRRPFLFQAVDVNYEDIDNFISFYTPHHIFKLKETSNGNEKYFISDIIIYNKKKYYFTLDKNFKILLLILEEKNNKIYSGYYVKKIKPIQNKVLKPPEEIEEHPDIKTSPEEQDKNGPNNDEIRNLENVINSLDNKVNLPIKTEDDKQELKKIEKEILPDNVEIKGGRKLKSKTTKNKKMSKRQKSN